MPTSTAGETRATVLSSNVNHGSRSAAAQRYDVVLDLADPGEPTRRIHLVGIALGPMLPVIGSSVAVAVSATGDVEIVWRGDPNLDLDAHRAQLADMAEMARRRSEGNSWSTGDGVGRK